MSESHGKNVSLIRYYIEKGEPERAKEIAEEQLQNEPEDRLSYILMAYYYNLLGQKVETLYWVKETMKRDPEDESILESAISLLDSIEHRDILKDTIETGLRLYPNNAFFHIHYAEMYRTENREQSKESFEEAIRLDPENDLYLGSYALFLYQMKDAKKAEKYEQLSLQYNPENSQMLLQFAWFAYQMKKFKKAQFLIDEALRIDPNDALIREYYEKIYPSRNGFIRATAEMKRILAIIFVYPAHLLWKLSKDKIYFGFILFPVLLLEFIGLHFLLGKNLYIALGIYFIILFISSKIKKSMLHKIGITDSDEVAMKEQTEATQKAALEEMKQEVSQNTVQLDSGSQTLSPDELEAQLVQIWNSDNITSIREQAEDKSVQNKKFHSSRISPARNKPVTVVFPKEDSKWPAYAMIAALVLVFAIRFAPYLIEQANRPEPVDPVIKESIELSQIQQEEEAIEALYNGEESEVVEQFLQEIGSDNLVDTISPYVSTEFESIILEKSDDPFLKQLANAQIEKIIQPQRGLSFYHFLVVNKEENTYAIIEVVGKKITNLFAEQWGESQEEIENFKTLMDQMESEDE